MPRPADAPQPVVLILADISGYTRYMTAHARSLAHGQAIITELVKVIVKQIELPLEVAKLEGDAVFLYGRKTADPVAWNQTRRVIGQKLLTFFEAFRDKVSELAQSTACSCRACTHIESLRLKIIVHSGEALFHRLLHFEELAGVDVIIVHRLLKNSVDADQYLLLTEAARQDLEFGQELPLRVGAENYESLGKIRTHVYLPAKESGPAAANVPAGNSGSFLKSWELFRKLWFAPLRQTSSAQPTVFQNITPATGKFARAGFAGLTLALTPLFLPAGLIVAFFHSRRHK